MAKLVFKVQRWRNRELKNHSQYLRVEDPIEMLVSAECYYNSAFGQILTYVDFDLEISNRFERLRGKTGELKALQAIDIYDYDIIEIWRGAFNKPQLFYNKGSVKQQRKILLKRIYDCLREHAMSPEDAASAAGRIVLMIDAVSADLQKGHLLERLQLWRDWKQARREALKPWSADEFVREVWVPAVRDQGFTQKDFKTRDRAGYIAFHNWCKYHGRNPGDFIPSSLVDPEEVVHRRGGRWPTHSEAIREMFRLAGGEGTALYRTYKAGKRRESEARSRARRSPKSG